MIITDIKVYVLQQPGGVKLIGDGSQDTVLVKVETDDGICGWGEADSSPYIVKQIIETPPSHMVCQGLKDIVVGQDPFDVEKIWDDMYRKGFYYGRRSAGLHAMSAIDIALYDIMGKAIGKPAYKLLGGKYHDKVRAYASLLMPDTKEELIEKAKHYKEMGFKAIKFGWGPLGKSIQSDIELVRTARETLGDDFMIMLDIAYAWKTGKFAARMCKALEPYNLYWIEEPVIADDLIGMEKVSERTSTNIASGEELTGLYEFRDLIERGKVDIVQPDVSRCGGITIAKKISEMALMRGIEFVPHDFKSGILMSASIQVLASYRGDPLLEYCSQETVLSKGLLNRHFPLNEDGTVDIPDDPGLGIEVNEEAVNKYRVL